MRYRVVIAVIWLMVFIIVMSSQAGSSQPKLFSESSHFEEPPPYWVVRALFYEPYLYDIRLGAYPYAIEESMPEVGELSSASDYQAFLTSDRSIGFRDRFVGLTKWEFAFILLRNFGTPEVRKQARSHPKWERHMVQVFKAVEWHKLKLGHSDETPEGALLWITN